MMHQFSVFLETAFSRRSHFEIHQIFHKLDPSFLKLVRDFYAAREKVVSILNEQWLCYTGNVVSSSRALLSTVRIHNLLYRSKWNFLCTRDDSYLHGKQETHYFSPD